MINCTAKYFRSTLTTSNECGTFGGPFQVIIMPSSPGFAGKHECHESKRTRTVPTRAAVTTRLRQEEVACSSSDSDSDTDDWQEEAACSSSDSDGDTDDWQKTGTRKRKRGCARPAAEKPADKKPSLARETEIGSSTPILQTSQTTTAPSQARRMPPLRVPSSCPSYLPRLPPHASGILVMQGTEDSCRSKISSCSDARGTARGERTTASLSRLVRLPPELKRARRVVLLPRQRRCGACCTSGRRVPRVDPRRCPSDMDYRFVSS